MTGLRWSTYSFGIVEEGGGEEWVGVVDWARFVVAALLSTQDSELTEKYA